MKIYVVGGTGHYARWLDGEVVDSLEEADLVLFRGGADVLPTLYDDVQHPKTAYDGGRDAKEIGVFARALALNKKMLGICRGSQFLTVMNGGRLIQDVTHHAIASQHQIEAPGIGEGMITSTHHQMMYPYNLPDTNYQVIAHPPEPRSKHYQVGNQTEIDLPENFVEPEIVFYPKTNSLGIQGHPERMNKHTKGVKLCKKIVDSYLFDKEL